MASVAPVASRRGSGLGLAGYQSPRAPPLATTKSNSLSLPDSPTVAGYQRGRSNSLRVIDDILLRRSNSLRQGLTNVGSGRRKSSLEDIGISHFSSSTNYSNPIKIALNGSIGLEVTPPEENSPPIMSSNTAFVVNPPPSASGSTLSLVQSGLPATVESFADAASQQAALPQGPAPDPQHLQGTIV